jgi:UDP-glucose 4-epimerase
VEANLRAGRWDARANTIQRRNPPHQGGGSGQDDPFRTDYPRPDGTCIRDYIQIADLGRADADALAYPTAGRPIGDSQRYGFSALEVIGPVKPVSASISPRCRQPTEDPARVAAQPLNRRCLDLSSA